MSSSIRLAVFDCDGTLVDSQHAINACMVDAFSAAGLAPPPLSEVRRVVGLPLKTAIEILASDEAAPVDAMTEAYSAAWMKRRTSGALEEPLFKGIRSMLGVFEDAGWLLGVATGKSMRGLSATLSHHGLENTFQTLQTADRARGKPDPEMLHLAMQETGADKRETVMIGDTTFDMEMARAAGVRAIGVTWGYHGAEELVRAGASAIVDRVADLGQFSKFAEETFS